MKQIFNGKETVSLAQEICYVLEKKEQAKGKDEFERRAIAHRVYESFSTIEHLERYNDLFKNMTISVSINEGE